MDKKIKILVCGIMPPPFFGHSMMYKMLMESDFVKAYEIIFLDMRFWSYEKHKKVTLDKIFKMAMYFAQFKWLLVRHRPKYVLFNMSFDKMPFLKDYLFCITGRILGARIVLHDMGQYLPELHQSSGWFYKMLIKHLLSSIEAIIVMGKKVREEYAPFFDLKRIYVVPGSVEDTVDIPGTRLPKINPDQIRVLYFSFLSVSKGIWTALKAIVEVVKVNKNVFFQFAGPIESEELLKEMNAYIDQQGLRQYFEYIGYIGDVQGRTACFRNADIFIFPTHRDVFGLVILHAMAEGIPVVASIEGTIPEIITDRINGFLFSKQDEHALAQKILTLARDEHVRQEMGQANRSRYLQVYAPNQYGTAMIRTFEAIGKSCL